MTVVIVWAVGVLAAVLALRALAPILDAWFLGRNDASE
jgi:hypothetical protein